MDTALILRLTTENKKILPNDEISFLLENSELLKKMTADYMEHPLFSVFRIVGLSEIPFIEKLPYTQKLLHYISEHLVTKEGFSCLGGLEEIVPCYNAMLLESYSRLGLSESHEVQCALEWIKKYQLFERNQTTSWTYDGICKHGGCLGKIPCYIGIGKTVRALITYSEFHKEKDIEVECLILKGLEYMLRHKLFQRLSNGKPISPHITDIMMPQNYALSLTDLVYIVGKRNLIDDTNTALLIALLKEKEITGNQWKIDYIYTYKGYVGFESRRKTSEWISSLFPIWLS